MSLLDWIVNAWLDPSAFRKDWRKFAKNQLGHALLIGAVPAYFLGLAGLVAVMALFTIWEWSQWWLRGAEPADAFEDWGFVFGGAMLGLTLDPGYAVMVICFLLAGVLWRRDG